MKFRVEIELGNDAMQTGLDIANALTPIVASLLSHPAPLGPQDGVQVGIRDENGNKVGFWEVMP